MKQSEIHSIIDTIEIKKVKLEKFIEERNNYYDERSDKWRESEKGDDYNEKTYEIENATNYLDDAIECLSELIE